MKDELNYKEDQLGADMLTAAKLSTQREHMQQDLVKVKNLEGRIKKEMEQAEQKLYSMNDDIENKFTKTDNL